LRHSEAAGVYKTPIAWRPEPVPHIYASSNEMYSRIHALQTIEQSILAAVNSPTSAVLGRLEDAGGQSGSEGEKSERSE
jgi:hypothetical protein